VRGAVAWPAQCERRTGEGQGPHGPEWTSRLDWPSKAELLRQLDYESFSPTTDERKEKLSYLIWIFFKLFRFEFKRFLKIQKIKALNITKIMQGSMNATTLVQILYLIFFKFFLNSQI
jgi:hypothetical protein